MQLYSMIRFRAANLFLNTSRKLERGDDNERNIKQVRNQTQRDQSGPGLDVLTGKVWNQFRGRNHQLNTFVSTSNGLWKNGAEDIVNGSVGRGDTGTALHVKRNP